MTATAGAPSTTIHWKTIIWSTVEYEVRRLQLRIAKAIKIGRYAKAKALQWLLTKKRKYSRIVNDSLIEA